MQSREQNFSGNSKKKKRNKKMLSHNNDIKTIQSDLEKGRIQFFMIQKA